MSPTTASPVAAGVPPASPDDDEWLHVDGHGSASWITTNSGASGTGNGFVGYTVAANTAHLPAGR